MITADISPLQSAAKVSGWYLRPERDLGLCSVCVLLCRTWSLSCDGLPGDDDGDSCHHGNFCRAVIEWKKFSNIEKSFLSQGWNLRNSSKNIPILSIGLLAGCLLRLDWFKLFDCFHTVQTRLGQARLGDWWLDKLRQVHQLSSVLLSKIISHLTSSTKYNQNYLFC